MAVLQKIHFEDAKNALLISEHARSGLASLKNRVANAYVRAIGRNLSSSDVETYKARHHMDRVLEASLAVMLDEFELGVTRGTDRQPLRHTNRVDYVNLERLSHLRALVPRLHDSARLVRMCEELNLAWQNESFHAVAMLVRAILDHVPPYFSQPSFAGVANHYAGSKSFRDAMKHLDTASRAIADGHLHTQVRQRESLPNDTQVDFRSGIDALLAEVLRLET